MSKDEIEDVGEILTGYENWRLAKMQLHRSNPLSVHEYLDELAKQRAYDAVQEIREVYADPELTWHEVDERIRAILGVQQ